MLKCNYLIEFPVKGYVYGLRAKITCLKRPLKAILFMLVLFLGVVRAEAVTHDLRSILEEATGDYVILNSEDTYVLHDGEYWFYEDMTIYGNGATIQLEAPLKACQSGITLTVDQCEITSTGWGALCGQPGSTIAVQNHTTISCIGGTGINISDASLTVQNSSISSCYIGVNITEDASGSTAQLHGVTISDSPYAVQVGGALSSVTIDQGSALSYSDVGTGVGVLQGASAIVHDTTLTGFTNAIDVPQFDPPGTVQAVNCHFLNNNCSALNAIHARDVLFSGCRVEGAAHDGLYFVESTGVVEQSEVIGSLNTGVTFFGCSDSTIRNSLIKDSAHQGLSIHDNPSNGVPSNVKVLNNTFVNNTITNLLIASDSTAQTQGNIFALAPTPNPSVRLHGPQGVTLHSSLFIGSYYGMDIKENSDPTIVLSSFTENDTQGILVYDNSSLTLHNSSFWSNGPSSWSVFVNEGAIVTARYCAFGPAADQAFYNNAGTTCDMANNFWDSTDGPQVDGGTGTGALLVWNPVNGSDVTYDPFCDQAPVESNVVSNLYLPSDGTLNWDSGLGITLNLTADTGSTELSNEIAGVLRANDTDHLNSVTPPPGLLSGHLYVVWVSTPLRLNSASGSLEFSLPNQEGSVRLFRRDIDGSWTHVEGTWNRSAHVLTYSPADIHLLNGTFALTSGGTASLVPLINLLLLSPR